MISRLITEYKRRKALKKLSGAISEPVITSENSEPLKRVVETHCQSGDNLFFKKQYDKAIVAYQCALALQADFPDAHNRIGLAYLEQNQLEEAITHLQTAVALDPANSAYHMDIGVALCKQKNFQAALSIFKYAASLKPNSPRILANLGFVLQETDQLEEAISTLKHALTLDPKFEQSYINLSSALLHATFFDEAIAVMEKAFSILPASPKLYINLGLVLYVAGRIDEAYAAFEKAYQLDNENENLAWNFAIIALKRGDYIKGWEKYESRWQQDMIKNALYTKRYAAYPRWQPGEVLAGKVIMLFCEQGLGDTLQFIRYAPILAQHCDKVILDCQQELKSLLASVEGISEIIGFNDPIPPIDLYCSVLSLPFLTQEIMGFKAIPLQVPYLQANAALVENWRKRLQHEKKFKVGLVWSGNLGGAGIEMKYNYSFRQRNIKLAQYAPLGDVKGVQFYSLQKGEAAEEAKNAPAALNLIDYSEQFNSFEETAAFIANLDLVISVDTSVVHLTGAIAKPLWMLNRMAGCYRWLNDREDTPWYPHMRIFHQKKPLQWDDVVAEIAEALKLAVDTFSKNKQQLPQSQAELIH